MWLGMITYDWGNPDNVKPVRIIGPFSSREEALGAVDGSMKTEGQRGFILGSAEEHVPGWSYCSKCHGFGTVQLPAVPRGDGGFSFPVKKCETCNGSGKIPKPSA